MNGTLAERLQAKLDDQTTEIAELTDRELKKLSKHVKQSATVELNGIENAIAKATDRMLDELPRLKWIVGATWAALIVSLALTGFLLWLSTQPLPLPNGFSEFQSQGQRYLMLPNGSAPLKCQDAGGAERTCLQMEN